MLKQKERNKKCQFDYRYELVVNLLNMNIGSASTRSSRCATPTKTSHKYYTTNYKLDIPLNAYDGHYLVRFKKMKGTQVEIKGIKHVFFVVIFINLVD